MNKMSSFIKVCVVVLFSVVLVSGCMKSNDPYSNNTPAREAGMISDWLAAMVSNKNDIDTTSTGLYYIVQTVGSGPVVSAKDTVTVKYTGLFLDGSIFDDSSYHGDGTMKFVYKVDSFIPGWNEALAVLKKGEKAAFLIPSDKAYGATGSTSIPPYTPLLFIIEVVDIK